MLVQIGAVLDPAGGVAPGQASLTASNAGVRGSGECSRNPDRLLAKRFSKMVHLGDAPPLRRAYAVIVTRGSKEHCHNGGDSFTYQASDGKGGEDTATVTIKVNAVNDAPRIVVAAGSASQSACLSDTTGRITLKLSDVDSNLSDLKPSVASSSDTNLVPMSNVAFGGTGGTRTATISTVPGRTGTSTVRITASDGQGSSTVAVTVKAGGKGRETLTGTSGADLLLGQNGDDTLSGAGGKDVLCGANGNDRLTGGRGSDTFDGGAGTDAATDYNAAAEDSKTNIP
jgi:Ca2+-binding RTX toxin-like protein